MKSLKSRTVSSDGTDDGNIRFRFPVLNNIPDRSLCHRKGRLQEVAGEDQKTVMGIVGMLMKKYMA